jgi:hypothetical protein
MLGVPTYSNISWGPAPHFHNNCNTVKFVSRELTGEVPCGRKILWQCICSPYTKTSKELGPSREVSSCSASQKFSILWNPKVCCRICKSSLLAPIPSQSNPVHTTPSHLSKMSSLVVSHLRLGLPTSLFSSGTPYMPLSSSLCEPHALPTSFFCT